MTPYLVLRSHGDGKGEVDVDRGSGHSDDWGRTLREEEQTIDGEGKKSELRKETCQQPIIK